MPQNSSDWKNTTRGARGRAEAKNEAPTTRSTSVPGRKKEKPGWDVRKHSIEKYSRFQNTLTDLVAHKLSEKELV